MTVPVFAMFVRIALLIVGVGWLPVAEDWRRWRWVVGGDGKGLMAQ